MIPLRITLDRDTEARALALLGQLADRAQDMPGALKAIGEALVPVAQARFDSQTDPSGKAWVPLAPLTVAIRGSATPILTVTGRLRGSIHYDVSGNALRIGPNATGDAVHQFGATIRPKNGTALRIPIPLGADPKDPERDAVAVAQVVVPARPYIGFGMADEQATRETIEDWLALEAADAAGEPIA